MDYWSFAAPEVVLPVGVLEELGAVEVLLLGAEEAFEVGLVVAGEVDLDELVLEEVRLADVLGGPPPPVLYPAPQLLFGNGLRVVVFLDDAPTGTVYVDLLQLASLPVVAVDLQDVRFGFGASGVGTEAHLFVVAGLAFADIVSGGLSEGVLLLIERSITLPFENAEGLNSSETAFTL